MTSSNPKDYYIQRYPHTKSKNLQAWNTADDMLLQYVEKMEIAPSKLLISNDRFGYLFTHLNEYKPTAVISYRSQEKAYRKNADNNKLSIDEAQFISPLADISFCPELVLIKIPKSLSLFRLLLQQIHTSCDNTTQVLAGFMTKYFNPQLLIIAGEYFEEVNQSKAYKKARLLILKGKKEVKKSNLIQVVKSEGMDSLKQYLGVFSANNVDYATQFLLESIPLKADDQLILDLASGNGIIAHSINQSYKEKAWSQPQIHLMDDDFLAVESSKLNLQGDQFVFKFNDNLSIFKEEYFDLIVSNPPFHFEHEVNIELPLSLFEQAQKALKKGGRFILVFNRHLTYRSQLQKLFNACNIIAENPRFVVLECVK